MDLILKGGRVIDPSQNLDGIRTSPSPAARSPPSAPASTAPRRKVRDVSGHIVSPGLIDLHTHVYWGGTSLGIDAEEFCRTSGVTTAIDTGSAGPGNFLGFRKHVIERSARRASSPICTSVSPASTPSPRPSWSARARRCA